MAPVLVDSNVLIDVLQEDPRWFDWSSAALERTARVAALVINPIVYAEVSLAFATVEELDAALPRSRVEREPLPFEAGFLAGRAFQVYRRRRGARMTPLPDFYIGAHAAIAGYAVLTRDAARYRTYFPTVDVIAPG